MTYLKIKFQSNHILKSHPWGGEGGKEEGKEEAREKREERERLTEICSDSREEVRELFDLGLQMGNCRFISYYLYLFFCRICDEWIFVWAVTF